jgi:hypothetical protein
LFADERVKRANESADRRGIAARELRVRREDESGYRFVPRERGSFKPPVVGHVFGHEDSRVGYRGSEHLLVACTLEPPVAGS